jgi:branched-chain amino acid transport system ATP-binding protein
MSSGERQGMLRIENVSTEYDGIPMLSGISLDVPEREIVCLLGSNGAGKSTLMKAILGLVRPVSGEITFRGERIDRLKTDQIVKAGISVVPEGRRIFPKLTTRENLRAGAFLERDLRTVRERMDRVFTLFPKLQERLKQLAGTLSGGEQGMVAIGRALMSNPVMILLDEPSLGLAPILVEQFFDAILKINRDGITVLVVEQNAAKALSVASYGYVLQKGRLVVEGSREALLEEEIIRKAYLLA